MPFKSRRLYFIPFPSCRKSPNFLIRPDLHGGEIGGNFACEIGFGVTDVENL